MCIDRRIQKIIQELLAFSFTSLLDYLESVVMSTGKLLITGDFNFHVDVPTDPINIHFRDLLDAMGLVQHVKQPTHIHGHTLDLIITRQSDDFVAEEPLSETFIFKDT